jgi:hypothetical protein
MTTYAPLCTLGTPIPRWSVLLTGTFIDSRETLVNERD